MSHSLTIFWLFFPKHSVQIHGEAYQMASQEVKKIYMALSNYQLNDYFL